MGAVSRYVTNSWVFSSCRIGPTNPNGNLIWLATCRPAAVPQFSRYFRIKPSTSAKVSPDSRKLCGSAGKKPWVSAREGRRWGDTNRAATGSAVEANVCMAMPVLRKAVARFGSNMQV